MNFGVRLELMMQSIIFLVCLEFSICLQHGEHLFLMLIITLVIKFIVDWFLKTEVGLAIVQQAIINE